MDDAALRVVLVLSYISIGTYGAAISGGAIWRFINQ